MFCLFFFVLLFVSLFFYWEGGGPSTRGTTLVQLWSSVCVVCLGSGCSFIETEEWRCEWCYSVTYCNACFNYWGKIGIFFVVIVSKDNDQFKFLLTVNQCFFKESLCASAEKTRRRLTLQKLLLQFQMRAVYWLTFKQTLEKNVLIGPLKNWWRSTAFSTLLPEVIWKPQWSKRGNSEWNILRARTAERKNQL